MPQALENKDLYVCALGLPIPDDPHAVSVSMPKWAHVVGYEENNPAIVSALKTAYPRFSYHRLYVKLCQKYAAKPGETILALPSPAVAEKCVAYAGAGRVEATPDGVALAVLPQALAGRAKEFWCDTGLIVSSRQSESILAGKPPAPAPARDALRAAVAPLYGAGTEDVYLHPSGMGSIFSAYEAVAGGKKAVQLGFPYMNTLKILQRYGEGVYVPYDTPADFAVLAAVLDQGGVSAVFCEIPGNPLLRTIDLEKLKALLHPRGIPLVVDDTVGPPLNVDLTPYADIIVTSLTKFFSGVGNVTGGSLVLNRKSKHFARLKAHLEKTHEDLLYPDDAEVLLANMRNFAPRMQKINANAAVLAAHLRAHPKIAEVYYPSGDPAYDALKKPGGGYGGLLSFTLKNPSHAPAVYDALAVAKGPSLGTEFTLACPYTLLAHYNELDWARENGVPAELIRVSVGMEEIEGILARFERTLKQ